ncbi:transcriptional regulator [Streptomyces griseocarneus]|nr:transcriptional regulator [Streptomyces griseocarneus]
MAGGTAAFAEQLRELKERSGLSYGALAKRLHMSTSTVHRYCNGAAVPTEYAPVERFAKLCGASRQEVIELHRRWIVADDERRRKATAVVAPSGETTPTETEEADESAEAAAPPAATDTQKPVSASPTPEPAPVAAPAPRPSPASTPTPQPSPAPSAEPAKPHRRRLRVALVAAAAVVIVPMAAAIGYSAASSGTRGTDSKAIGPEPGAGSTRTPRPKEPWPGFGPPSALPSPGASKDPRTAQPGPGGTPGPDTDGSGPDSGGTPDKDAPLTVDVRPYALPDRCDQMYVTGRVPAAVPAPPTTSDARDWVTGVDAVPGGRMRIQVSVQGRSGQAVVLHALHVRVANRAAPLSWNGYAMGDGCGGGLTPAHFDVDLDRERPDARPVTGMRGDIEIPATGFPYKTSATDPQMLEIVGRTNAQDVSWYLELEWSSGDRHGTLRLDDRGRPFRTSAIKDRPQYAYQFGSKKWQPLPDYARRP